MLFQKYRYSGIVVFGVAAFLALSGCSPDLTEPSWTSPHRVQVREHRFVKEAALSEVSDAFFSGTASHYRRYGSGPLVLSVTYDPNLKGGMSMAASDKAAHFVSELRGKGVRDVKIDLLPVKGAGRDGKLIVSYTSYTAHAPKDCGVLPGLADTEIAYDRDYKLGCSVETLLARQIVRPRDLLGVGSVDSTTDGRRAANISEGYRTGAQNEPLEGESASE